MSYDIYIYDQPDGGQIMHLGTKLDLRGGTYAMGGTDQAWLNMTYNYAPILKEVLQDDRGIRCLYGRKVADTAMQLAIAVSLCGNEPPTSDYWEPTKGNVRLALSNLLALAALCPNGYWRGD